MDLDFQQLASLEPDIARSVLPAFLAGYVDEGGGAAEAFGTAVAEAVSRTSDAELSDLLDRFAHAGEEYRLYPASPAARRVSRAAMATLVTEAEVSGLEHLRRALEGPCLILCNHLSYVDTQITDLLLSRAGAEDVANALVTVAGPKVYEAPFRRVAAVCLNTIKTAQSTHLSHNEAHLSPREVGRIALETVRQATELMAAGQPVLLYGEGSRSRDGHLNPFLKAVSKYATLPELHIVPTTITGTDRLFPVDCPTMRPASVALRFGRPLEVAPLGPRAAVDEAWRDIAAALPERHRPAPETPPTV